MFLKSIKYLNKYAYVVPGNVGVRPLITEPIVFLNIFNLFFNNVFGVGIGDQTQGLPHTK